MKNCNRGNKPNIYISFGLLLNGIMIMLNRYVVLPDFIHGMSMGIAIGLIVIGVWGEKYGFEKIKRFKKKLFNIV